MAPCGNESCCTRPILSSVLSSLTLATFIGAFCLLFLAGDKKCDCEGSQCCADSSSEDPCADDECYCPFNILTRDDICREKEHELSRIEAIFFLVFIAIGIVLIVVSSISCCCCAKKKSFAYQETVSGVAQGFPRMEMGML